MDLVARATGRAAAIIGDLPGAIASRADFEKEAHVLLEGQKLADAPVEREMVAGRYVEIFFLLVRFVGQRRDDGCRFVSHRIPRDRALELVRPEPVAEIVRGLDPDWANGRHCDRFRVVLAN